MLIENIINNMHGSIVNIINNNFSIHFMVEKIQLLRQLCQN